MGKGDIKKNTEKEVDWKQKGKKERCEGKINNDSILTQEGGGGRGDGGGGAAGGEFSEER